MVLCDIGEWNSMLTYQIQYETSENNQKVLQRLITRWEISHQTCFKFWSSMELCQETNGRISCKFNGVSIVKSVFFLSHTTRRRVVRLKMCFKINLFDYSEWDNSECNMTKIVLLSDLLGNSLSKHQTFSTLLISCWTKSFQKIRLHVWRDGFEMWEEKTIFILHSHPDIIYLLIIFPGTVSYGPKTFRNHSVYFEMSISTPCQFLQ